MNMKNIIPLIIGKGDQFVEAINYSMEVTTTSVPTMMLDE
jgi:hypothetical protein